MTAAFIGPTGIIRDGMFPPRYDLHMQAWRFHCWQTGNYHYWPRYSNRIVYGVRQ